MTAEPKKKAEQKLESKTDLAKLQRQRQGKEPIDLSDMPEKDASWFEKAEFTQPGQIAYKLRMDSNVLDWYKKHFPKYRSTISQVLREYRRKNIKPLVTNDRIVELEELTWKFDPDVVQWLKTSKPSQANLILRDFMQDCISKGEPK